MEAQQKQLLAPLLEDIKLEALESSSKEQESESGTSLLEKTREAFGSEFGRDKKLHLENQEEFFVKVQK